MLLTPLRPSDGFSIFGLQSTIIMERFSKDSAGAALQPIQLAFPRSFIFRLRSVCAVPGEGCFEQMTGEGLLP